MLLKKVSVKGIGELRHLGLACVHLWPESRPRWDLVENFFCGEPTRVTSLAAGDYVGYRRLGSCGKANYNVFWFSIGAVQTLFRDSPKPLKTKQ